MADPVLTPRQLRSARERLIDRGVTDASVPPSSIGVRPAIERSWRRAVAQHIAADAAAARFVNAINADDPLLRAAAPVVEHWQDCLSGMHVATFLSDRNGQIVARRVSDRGDMRRLDQAFAAEGFDFSESSLGTNGLGTAIEDRVPVFVRGGEHFSESLESLACAGAPIRDLGTGQVLGSIDRHVNNDRAVRHIFQHVPRDEPRRRRARDQHRAHDQIGLRHRIVNHVSARGERRNL